MIVQKSLQKSNAISQEGIVSMIYQGVKQNYSTILFMTRTIFAVVFVCFISLFSIRFFQSLKSNKDTTTVRMENSDKEEPKHAK